MSRYYKVEIGSFNTNEFEFEYFDTEQEANDFVAYWNGRDGLEAWIVGRPDPKEIERRAREAREYEQRRRDEVRAEAERKLAKDDHVLCWAWYWNGYGDANVVFGVAHSVDEVLKLFEKCEKEEDYRWDGLE